MNKSLCINRIYPNLVDQIDFEVVDNGEQVVEWYNNLPQPTEAELANVWPDILKNEKKREMEFAFVTECEKDFSSPFLLVAALKLNEASDRTKLNNLDTRLKKLKTKYQEIENAPREEASIRQIGW